MQEIVIAFKFSQFIIGFYAGGLNDAIDQPDASQCFFCSTGIEAAFKSKLMPRKIVGVVNMLFGGTVGIP